jgi:hypothetical protein
MPDMKLGNLIVLSLLIIALLITPSFAAIKTVSYTSYISPTLTDWDLDHTLKLFDPALGKLTKVDFYVTINGTLIGEAENKGDSVVRYAYMQDNTDMDPLYSSAKS